MTERIALIGAGAMGGAILGLALGGLFGYLLAANTALRADLEQYERRLDAFSAFLKKQQPGWPRGPG